MVGQRFSGRTGWDLGEGDLARAVRESRAAGRELVDLTVSNPTVCGFAYDEEAILGALRNAAAMTYDPDPRGIRSAREAVAEYYSGHGAEVDADDLILTTSTSEAYSFLFRLLCDAGDSVLAAQPGYPLFDFLAGLDDVRLETYPLFYDFGWWIDFGELERRIGPRTRAVVLVHPNNPTGHATGAAEMARLMDLCARHGLALIVDEVFLDYGLERPVETVARLVPQCLTFVVSGLSKIAALPQMKVGWLLALGSEAARRQALARLEVVADTFLSMNAPAQLALPRWLSGRETIQRQILARVHENLGSIVRMKAVTSLPVEAGWNAILRIPQSVTSDDPAIAMLRVAGVLVHPGWFYGMAGERMVVISTIGPVESTRCGLQQMDAWYESKLLT